MLRTITIQQIAQKLKKVQLYLNAVHVSTNFVKANLAWTWSQRSILQIFQSPTKRFRFVGATNISDGSPRRTGSGYAMDILCRSFLWSSSNSILSYSQREKDRQQRVFAARRSALARHLSWRRSCLYVCLCVCQIDVLCPNDRVDHHATLKCSLAILFFRY